MEDINFKNIPDTWEGGDDEDLIVSNLVRLEITNKERLYQEQLDNEDQDNNNNNIQQQEVQPQQQFNLKYIEEEEEKEEPLLLINFTKWSYDKIKWKNGVIENNDLFQRLLSKLNQDSEFFITMTDDLMERELAFHTTNKSWRSDIKLLEEQYGSNNFFSPISYPPIVGGFLVDEIWLKIKERTEWKSVNILKCIYLAKSNRPLLYKHQMAMSIEFLALEQKLLGPTAKRLIDEEEQEYQLQLKQYQERMQKLYENEINEGIIKNLQQQIYLSEGIVNNIDRINNINQITNEKLNSQQDNQEDDDDEEEYSSYCSTCNGSDQDYSEGDEMVDDDNNNNNNNNNNINNQNEQHKEEEEEEVDDDDDEDNKSITTTISTTSSYEQSDDDDADNELDEEDTRKKKKEKLIEQRKIKEIQDEKVIKQREKERLKSEKPPSPPLNILDKIMAMIFSKLLIQSNKEYHYQMLSKLQESIKESWISELGLLPPSSLWRDNPFDD